MNDVNIPQFGPNHTGTAIHEDEAESMAQAARRFRPSSTGTSFAAEAEQIRFACSHPCSIGLGSVPTLAEPPAADLLRPGALTPERLALLLDKLGARLAFERTGVRLYEGLLAKFDAFGEYPGGPKRSELVGMLADEHRHFKLLSALVDRLGGDPTAVTPAADVASVLATGVVQVIADPRTTLAQGLEAISTAELTDNEGWTMLTLLGRELLVDDVVEQFEAAEQTERVHLGRVRQWLQAACAVATSEQGSAIG
jgi:hypothetical protein